MTDIVVRSDKKTAFGLYTVEYDLVGRSRAMQIRRIDDVRENSTL